MGCFKNEIISKYCEIFEKKKDVLYRIFESFVLLIQFSFLNKSFSWRFSWNWSKFKFMSKGKKNLHRHHSSHGFELICFGIEISKLISIIIIVARTINAEFTRLLSAIYFKWNKSLKYYEICTIHRIQCLIVNTAKERLFEEKFQFLNFVLEITWKFYNGCQVTNGNKFTTEWLSYLICKF